MIGDHKRNQVLCLSVLAGLAAASFTPLAGLVYFTTPAIAFVLCAALIYKRDFVTAIELVIWCWLLAPWLRRVIDLQIGFHAQSLVLLAPVAATAPLALAILFVKTTLPSGLVRGMFGLMASLVVGAALAITQLLPVAAAAGVVAWLPPVVLGISVAVLPIGHDSLVSLMSRVGIIGSLVVGGYGVVQWVFVPHWDAVWLASVNSYPAISFGQPFPFEVRVFSTLNSPGPAASALLFLIVMASVAKAPAWIRLVSVTVGLAGLGLTEVRQVYLAAVLYFVLALFRRVYSARSAIAFVSAVVAVVLLLPAAQESVGQRITSSAESGSSDRSLQERVAFQRDQFSDVIDRPVGVGIGSTGSGARATEKFNAFGNSDSGYLEIGRSFGLPVGLAFLASLLLVSRSGAKSRGPSVFTAALCLTLTVPFQLLLGNVFTSSTGAVSYLALFLCGMELRVPHSSATENHREFA